ncbi:hypothetical protein [Terricaulis silvestris]|uniref:Uncharacterized protein n=1 Tax=Terricaulis silvestris TaxID=2686094 RepID=A0A6I6MSI7_9CAUL|nr:hypothetical protein [Terricaulis silvestris]QGZ95544.1 hypothetical protein DSM104635_02394 [Terricaulis silvestris]
MSLNNPTRVQVAAWIDVLDGAEPQHLRGRWGEAYDRLHTALRYARKVRRYSAIPSALIAVVLVIIFHGEVWDFDDIYNLLGLEMAVLFTGYFVLTKMFAVLAEENRVQSLLRHYGAQDVPHEEEAMQ